MTMETEILPEPEPTKPRRLRVVFFVGGLILFLVLVFFFIILILTLTQFKARDPEINLVSASLEGVSPRIAFPVINVELNLTLNVTLLVYNPNYASLRHGVGKSFLYYKDHQVGEADLDPGLIPSRGSSDLLFKLNLEVDEFADDIPGLIQDILSGQLVVESRTLIPGRAKLLGGMIKKHVVATYTCSFTIAFPAVKIQEQKCHQKTKF